MVKNPPVDAGDVRDTGSISGSGRSPGGRHGNPLWYSCFGNSADRWTWWATVHGVAEYDMTEQMSTHSQYRLTLQYMIYYWITFVFAVESRLLTFKVCYSFGCELAKVYSHGG